MKKLSARFVRVMLYVFGFASIIAAAVACGYVLIKDEDEGNRTAAKRSLILSAGFVGLNAVVTLYRAIVISLIGAGGAAYTVADVLTALITIAEIAVFAVLAILAYTEGGAAAGGQKKAKEKKESAAADAGETGGTTAEDTEKEESAEADRAE